MVLKPVDQLKTDLEDALAALSARDAALAAALTHATRTNGLATIRAYAKAGKPLEGEALGRVWAAVETAFECMTEELAVARRETDETAKALRHYRAQGTPTAEAHPRPLTRIK